jgi:hypothetical protein
MNFGKWIAVAFVLFAMFIGTLVTVCVREDISLVSKNYYNDELKYQDQIGRINNTNLLSEKPSIAKVENRIRVEFGNQFEIQKGELRLFCPSDPKMDKDFTLSATSGSRQSFDITSMKGGMYKARLLWKVNGKEYFLEKIIYI